MLYKAFSPKRNCKIPKSETILAHTALYIDLQDIVEVTQDYMHSRLCMLCLSNLKTVRYPHLMCSPPLHPWTSPRTQRKQSKQDTETERPMPPGTCLKCSCRQRQGYAGPACCQIVRNCYIDYCNAVPPYSLQEVYLCRCSCYTNPVENMSAEDSAIGALGFARTTGLYCTVITSSREHLET